MSNVTWGLSMMVVGMGVVFLLLLLLMVVLIVIGRLDRPEAAAAIESPEPQRQLPADAGRPTVTVAADGLDDDTVAAIAIAVMTHADNRRKIAASEVRSVEPGSQLFASRWVSAGRGRQNDTFRRR